MYMSTRMTNNLYIVYVYLHNCEVTTAMSGTAIVRENNKGCYLLFIVSLALTGENGMEVRRKEHIQLTWLVRLCTARVYMWHSSQTTNGMQVQSGHAWLHDEKKKAAARSRKAIQAYHHPLYSFWFVVAFMHFFTARPTTSEFCCYRPR